MTTAQARADAVEAVVWYAAHTGRPASSPCCPSAVPLSNRGRARRDARHIPEQAVPAAMERAYRRRLLKRAKEVHDATMAALRPALATLAKSIEAEKGRDDGRRSDSLAGDLRSALQVVRRVARVIENMPPDPTDLESLGQQVVWFADRAVLRQVATVIGIDMDDVAGVSGRLVQGWVSDNVALIKSIDARYFDEIEAAVEEAVRKGQSTEALTERIERRYAVSQSRARLIADDQIGTLNAKVTEARQTSLGIERYTWSSSGDNRVRPLHVQLDTTVRRWDDPHPTEGHPGEPIRCRCSAIPVVSRGDHARLRVQLSRGGR